MYNFKDIKKLHLEISSNCQASCPMCVRNHHGGIENPRLNVSDLGLGFFKNNIGDEFLKQLDSIMFCGNFGDPILNQELIPILEYIVSCNADIRIDLHTNGSARSVDWWIQLATALPKNHVVHFALDGLEDTHHLYRVGTSFNKIIDNAKAFIAHGGRARWVYIIFKHNEHQVELARQMATDLGFESFQEKETSRFMNDPTFDVLDKNGVVTHKLEKPTNQRLVVIDPNTIKNYKKLVKMAKVECQVRETKSIYIDALGYAWPCCWVGAVPYIHTYPTQIIHDFQVDSYKSLFSVLDQFGGMEQLNMNKRSLSEIVDSYEWQNLWVDNYNNLNVCARTCGKFPEKIINQPDDQFIDLRELNG